MYLRHMSKRDLVLGRFFVGIGLDMDTKSSYGELAELDLDTKSSYG